MLFVTNTLLIDRVSVVVREDFEIHDGSGKKIGRIHNDGGFGSRLVMGHRKFTIYDGDTASFKFDDEPNVGPDKFRVTTTTGDEIATIENEITLVYFQLAITFSDGRKLHLSHHATEVNYKVEDDDGNRVASVAWESTSFKSMLLDHDRYEVTFEDHATKPQRQAVIGSVIASELIQDKENKPNSDGNDP